MRAAVLSHVEPLLLLLERYMPLSEDDRHALTRLVSGPPIEKAAREDLAREGDNPTVIRLLVSGWACRYKDLPDGRRQIVGFFLPGDFCDLNVYIVRALDHSIGALTRVRYYDIDPVTLHQVIDARPHLIRAMLWHEMVTSSIMREWLVSMGQRSASERLAHLFIELYQRLKAVGLAQDHCFHLPITQQHLAEASGISPVHINRTLQELRREGLIELADRHLRFPDFAQLREFAMFNKNYLHFESD